MSMEAYTLPPEWARNDYEKRLAKALARAEQAEQTRDLLAERLKELLLKGHIEAALALLTPTQAGRTEEDE